MALYWTKLATHDLDNIQDYIYADNPKAAVRVVFSIINYVETVLPFNPAIGRAGRVFGTRELIMSELPYLIIYNLKLDDIYVVRVLHSAQQWPS